MARRLLALLCLTSAAGWSQVVFADDLWQTWQAAQAHDPGYAAAQAQFRASQQKVPQARARLLPRLDAAGGVEHRQDRSTHNFERAGNRQQADWALRLTQPVYDRAAWKQMAQSRLVQAEAELALEQARQDLMLRVAQAYFDILSAQDTLTALQAEQRATTDQLHSAQRRFELGAATVTDIHEARARLDLLAAQELQLLNDLDIRRDQLAQMTGRYPDTLSRLPAGLALPAPEPNRIEPWSEQAQSANLAVLRAQLASEIAQQSIEIARSGHYPTLSLQAGSSQSTTQRFDEARRGRPIENTVGLQLSIPLYSGGGVSAQVEEQVQLQQKARFEQEAARRQAIQTVRAQFQTLHSGLGRIEALEAGEASSRAAVEANLIGYEIGVRINLDVLASQQQLYATQSALAQVRYDTLMAGLRLKAAGSTLSEIDLEEINALLARPPESSSPAPSSSAGSQTE